MGAGAAGGSADFGSGGFEFARFHLGDVDDGARHVIRVVCENVQRDVLHDLLQPLELPVVAGVPMGHTAHNYAWIHGEVGELRPDGIVWP